MTERKGSSSEKTYRSRNRAISALVQSSKNIVITDLSIDSANVIDLIDSSYVSDRAGGAGLDSALVNQLIDSDYILAKKFVPGDGERRLNITTAAPTGTQQVSTGDFWLDRDDFIFYRLTADGNWSTSLPAGSFSAEAGLTSHNVFEANAGADTASFTIGSSHTPVGPSGSFNSTFRISTSPYNSGGRWTFSSPVNFSYYYMGNSDAGHLWSIGYTDGSYMVANGGLAGSKTATPSSYTWYDADGNSLGKTISQGNSGAHTHDVRHPNGVLATYIIHGRNNYGTRDYDAWLWFSGANYWQRVGEIYDSGDIRNIALDSALTTQLVDSAYIQLRDRFQDSSGILAIVDSAYVQLRQSGGAITVQEEGSSLSTSATTLNFVGSGVTATGSGATKTITVSGGGGGGGGLDSATTLNLINSQAKQTTFTYTTAHPTTTISGNDDNGAALLYNSGNIIVFQNGILLVDSADYTATTGNSVVLGVATDSGDIVSITKFTGAGGTGHSQFKFVSASPQTTFSGLATHGGTLSYDVGNVQVFLNGILLVDSQDYTATNGTSIVLAQATDSNDVLAVSKFGGGSSNALLGGMFRTNPQTLTINTTIDSNLNAHCAGPISFDSGVTLTINGNLVIS